MTARALGLAVVAALALALAFARAAAAAPAAASALAEAQRHFRRGVELYREDDMTGALVEFTRAHDLVPSYKILYNIAQADYELKDYAAALRHFRAYLDEGGAEIPGDRRREVERELPRLEGRVGRLVVHVPEAGVPVFVDDVAVGTSPLGTPLVVNVGRRKVEAASGPNGERRAVFAEVASGETVTVTLPPEAPPPLPAAHLIAASPYGPLLAEPAAPPAASAPALPPSRGPRRRVWVTWSATALAAAGAAVTGGLAYTESRQLQKNLNAFPVMPGDVNATQQRAHGLAIASDALLVGALALASLSLYFTFSQPSAEHAH
jgi:hypothetical protein